MCTNDDLRAQARVTSRDVMRIMGGVALALLGLFGLGIALAVGWANEQIEPFRAGMTIGAVTAVIGVIVGSHAWSHSLLIKELKQSTCSCPSANGQAKDNTVALIEGRRF